MSPEDRLCECCDEPIANPRARRFCSQECWRRWERTVATANPQTSRRKRAYGRWYRMHERCSNPHNPHWERYGARGIYVCERWMDFDAYYADTGDAPRGMTLDRIDNDGPYSPENTRWATPVEQRANQEYDHMRIKTHCKNGHPFDEANTHIDRRGWRSCRACSRAKRMRQRAAAAARKGA